MENAVHLVYSGGDDDYEAILFSVLSAMRKTKLPLRVTLLTALLDYSCGKPIERAKARYLQGLLKGRRDESDLVYIDMTGHLTRLIKKAPSRHFEKPYELIFLLLDRADLRGRILYLSPETLFSQDASKAYDHPLEGFAVGCACIKHRALTAHPQASDGVLLVDMEKACRIGFFEKARALFIGSSKRRPLQGILEGRDLFLCRLPDELNEQGRLKKNTVIRSYRSSFRLFPYPHYAQFSPNSCYGVSGREYRQFERVHEEYLLQREGRV